MLTVSLAFMPSVGHVTVTVTGTVPGWPGVEVCPPQPMVAQQRAVLDRYAAAGGTVEEVVLDDAMPWGRLALGTQATVHLPAHTGQLRDLRR